MRGEDGAIIVYRLPPGIRPARRVRFMENVWGQTRKARGYTVRRHGTLERVPLWKIGRGVVVVRASDASKVVQELERWKAEVRWWRVRLEPEQARQLTAAVN
jgi:hypothetical protein